MRRTLGSCLAWVVIRCGVAIVVGVAFVVVGVAVAFPVAFTAAFRKPRTPKEEPS